MFFNPEQQYVIFYPSETDNSRDDYEVVKGSAGIFGPDFECHGHHHRYFSPVALTRSDLMLAKNHRRNSS
jgi:hypothetical protein